MKIRSKSRLAFSLFFVVLLFFSFLIITKMNKNRFPDEVASFGKPAVSPSGDYLLELTIPDPAQDSMVSFAIKNRNNEVVFVPHMAFSNRSTTFFLWDDNEERVWVYSGDIGTFFWEISDDDKRWKHFSYAKEKVEAPQFLKDTRPSSFR